MGLCRGRGVAAGFAILIGLGGTAVGDSRVAEIMARDGQLRDGLQVRDGQHGVVGETGTLWVIEPSGAFTVSRFVNSKVGPTERAGSSLPNRSSSWRRAWPASAMLPPTDACRSARFHQCSDASARRRRRAPPR